MTSPVGTKIRAKADHSFKMIIDGQKWKFKVYDSATGNIINPSHNLGVLEAVAREGIKGSLAITAAAGAASKTVERIQFNVTNVIADPSTSELGLADGAVNPNITNVEYNANPADKTSYTKASPTSPPDITAQITKIKDAVLNPKDHASTSSTKSGHSEKSSRSSSSSSSAKADELPKAPKHHQPKTRDIEKSNTEILTAFLKGQGLGKGKFDEVRLIKDVTRQLNEHLPDGAKKLTEADVRKEIQKRLGKLKISDRPDELKSAIQEVFKMHGVNVLLATKNKGTYTLTPALDKPLDLHNTVLLVSSAENIQCVTGKGAEKELHAAGLRQAPFAIENGGAGDCAARALAGARMLNQGAWIADDTTRQALHKAEGFQIRREVTEHMHAHPKEYFGDMIRFQHALSAAIAKGHSIFTNEADQEKLTLLLGKSPATLIEKEKTFLVQTYAAYASKPGVWLDGPFFLGYAKKYGADIAIVTESADRYRIDSSFRKDAKERPIPKDGKGTLFIYFNGSNHYQTFNIVRSKITSQKSARLSQIVQDCNDSEKPQRVRRTFLSELSKRTVDRAKLSNALHQLKRVDKQGYLTLTQLAKDELRACFTNSRSISKLVTKLTTELGASSNADLAIKLEARITSSYHLQSRAGFYRAFNERDETKLHGKVLDLKSEDPELYLTLEELLSGLTPEDNVAEILRMYQSPSRTPDGYFEAEVNKRPYLDARAAFFKVLDSESAATDETYLTQLETAIARLRADDQQTYLILKDLTKVESDEAKDIAEALIRGKVTEQAIKERLYQYGCPIAWKKYIDAFADTTDRADERLKACMISLKKEIPYVAIHHSERQGNAKPEDDVAAIRANPIRAPLPNEILARHLFFKAQALHMLKDGAAYTDAITPVLCDLAENDPQGYAAVRAFVTRNMSPSDPTRELTPEELGKQVDLLKGITFDDVQGLIYPAARSLEEIDD